MTTRNNHMKTGTVFESETSDRPLKQQFRSSKVGWSKNLCQTSFETTCCKLGEL